MIRRAEAEAFVTGFAFCYSIIRREVPSTTFDDTELRAELVALSDEIYPPFDEPPEPKKASRKGMKEPWEPGFFEEQNATLGRGVRSTK